MQKPPETFFNVEDFRPELRQVFKQPPLNAFGDRRDAELRDIYSALRRRPDGRSLGFVHDYIWQAAALILGTRPLSQAEFEAIMARMERSCRTFEQGPTSRNLVAALRHTFGRAGNYYQRSHLSIQIFEFKIYDP